MSGWIQRAKIGDHVVCVDASVTTALWLTLDCLEKGNVYTISEITCPDGVILFDLAECPYPFRNPTGPFKGMSGYRSSRFRPVRKTSIEVFERLLNTAPAKVTEDA